MLAVVGIAAGTFLVGCFGGLAVANFNPDSEEPPPAASPSAVGEPTDPSPTAGEPTESPEPTEIPVLAIPDNLVGINAAVAEDELRRLGFERIEFGSADPDETVVILPQNWTVVEVAPEPGSEVPADSTIVLTCTKQ